MNDKWIDRSDLLIRIPQKNINEPEFLYYDKIAGFNFDYTLIKPKSDIATAHKAIIYKSCDDWSMFHTKLISKMIELHIEKYSIVIFSDQTLINKSSGVSNQTREDIKNRFDSFIKLFYRKKIPIIGFFSLKNNICRKPYTGMWRLLRLLYKSKRFELPKENISFYVGNLAGRKPTRQTSKHGKHSRDISHIDRAFAYNIGLRFYTPELFLLKKQCSPWIYPASIISREDTIRIQNESIKLEISEPFKKGVMHYLKKNFGSLKQFLIIIVGPPTSTKTTMSKYIIYRTSKYIKNGKLKPWHIIDIDSFGRMNKSSTDRCVKKLNEEITHGNSVIIDGTNELIERRKIFIDVVKNFDIGIIIIDLQVSIDIAKHLNNMKVEIAGKFAVERTKKAAFTRFTKNYKKPTKEEFDKLDIPQNRYQILEYPFILINIKEWWYIYDKL